MTAINERVEIRQQWVRYAMVSETLFWYEAIRINKYATKDCSIYRNHKGSGTAYIRIPRWNRHDQNKLGLESKWSTIEWVQNVVRVWERTRQSHILDKSQAGNMCFIAVQLRLGLNPTRVTTCHPNLSPTHGFLTRFRFNLGWAHTKIALDMFTNPINNGCGLNILLHKEGRDYR